MIDRMKAHSEQELTTIFKQNGCPDKFFSKFISLYNNSFEEFKTEYEECCEDDYKEGDEDTAQADALCCTMERLKRFIKEINLGQGEEWATLVSDLGDTEYNRAIKSVYWILRKKDKELAKKEIQIHSKSFGEDALFEKHYLDLFENGDSMDCPHEVARKYSRIYKQQREQGKSEIYADKYADYMACGDYPEISCRKNAIAYEKAILEGIDESSARCLADEYAEAIANEYHYTYLLQFIKDFPVNLKEEELEEFIIRTVLDNAKEKLHK